MFYNASINQEYFPVFLMPDIDRQTAQCCVKWEVFLKCTDNKLQQYQEIPQIIVRFYGNQLLQENKTQVSV
jgi:hypothetical protein